MLYINSEKYFLAEDGFLPVAIKHTSKEEYYDALMHYQSERNPLHRDPRPLAKIIERLEGQRLDKAIKAVRADKELRR